VAIDNSNFAGTGDVIETNGNNNEKWKTNVLEPEGTSTGSKVDLVVSEVREDPNQETTVSDNLTFLMELKNVGTAPAQGFYVGFYLSPDQSITTDDIYIG
jgi:subtilase family serine protease